MERYSMITDNINILRQPIPLKQTYRVNATKIQNPRRKEFLKQDRKTLTIKQMIDKLNNRKFKNFCSLKDTFKNIKGQVTEWGKSICDTRLETRTQTKHVNKKTDDSIF